MKTEIEWLMQSNGKFLSDRRIRKLSGLRKPKKVGLIKLRKADGTERIILDPTAFAPNNVVKRSSIDHDS
jgi:hypothetical protein